VSRKFNRFFNCVNGGLDTPEGELTMVRILGISDIHGNSMALAKAGGMARENQCDLILLCGDISVHHIYHDFYYLLEKTARHAKCMIILTLGNHDTPHPEKYFSKSSSSVVCLVDQSIEYKGLKIYGTPWTKRCGDWNYMLDTEDELAEKFKMIPEDTDILISHGPPFGFGDNTREGRIGSEALTQAIQERPNLKLVVFGHNHGSFGWEGRIGNTVLCNVACHDDDYQFRPEGIKIVDVQV